MPSSDCSRCSYSSSTLVRRSDQAAVAREGAGARSPEVDGLQAAAADGTLLARVRAAMNRDCGIADMGVRDVR
jgi:hypothetical protein